MQHTQELPSTSFKSLLSGCRLQHSTEAPGTSPLQGSWGTSRNWRLLLLHGCCLILSWALLMFLMCVHSNMCMDTLFSLEKNEWRPHCGLQLPYKEEHRAVLIFALITAIEHEGAVKMSQGKARLLNRKRFFSREWRARNRLLWAAATELQELKRCLDNNLKQSWIFGMSSEEPGIGLYDLYASLPTDDTPRFYI